jgi:hypothetical protein
MSKRRPGESLRFFALLFLLPGLAGVIYAGWVSARYFATLPRMPIPEQSRIFPRSINGTVVYQTQEEDRRLTLLEESAIAFLAIGLSLAIIHLRRWGIQEVLMGGDAEEDPTPKAPR